MNSDWQNLSKHCTRFPRGDCSWNNSHGRICKSTAKSWTPIPMNGDLFHSKVSYLILIFCILFTNNTEDAHVLGTRGMTMHRRWRQNEDRNDDEIRDGDGDRNRDNHFWWQTLAAPITQYTFDYELLVGSVDWVLMKVEPVSFNKYLLEDDKVCQLQVHGWVLVSDNSMKWWIYKCMRGLLWPTITRLLKCARHCWAWNWLFRLFALSETMLFMLVLVKRELGPVFALECEGLDTDDMFLNCKCLFISGSNMWEMGQVNWMGTAILWRWESRFIEYEIGRTSDGTCWDKEEVWVSFWITCACHMVPHHFLPSHILSAIVT